jgi:RNA polymerase sigma factor (sigma-70 family)
VSGNAVRAAEFPKPQGGAVRLSGVGDDPQLAEFCRTEWPRLVGSIGLYFGDRELAEDLAQETLVRVCANWAKVRDAESPSAWAHRVAFNLAKSHLRRQATWRRLRPRALASLGAVADDDAAVVAVAVRDAVAALPEAQRETLVLRYFADLSVHDVAIATGLPENTVKTHTRRALESLRRRGLLEPDDLAASGSAPLTPREATP